MIDRINIALEEDLTVCTGRLSDIYGWRLNNIKDGDLVLEPEELKLK